jgi:AraC-like DNA-binding protein
VNISILLIRAVLAELRGRGFDELHALHGTGLDEEALRNLSTQVSLESWEQVVLRAQALTEDPMLALAAAQHLPLSALQWLGPLLRATGSLREAIDVFERHAMLLAEPLSWSLREQGEQARLVCQPLVLREQAARFAVELALGIALRVGAHLIGRRVGPVISVELACAPPQHAAAYQERWGYDVRFQQREHAIVLPRSLLDEPRTPWIHDPALELIRGKVDALMTAHTQRALVDRVRAILWYEADLSHFEPAHVARTLGLSERVLRRRLAEEGMPLAELLGEVRRMLAIREMQRPDVAIKQLSERLGFSEPSAFHRAFKRWTGKTPSEYGREPGSMRSGVLGEPGEDASRDPSGVFHVHEMSRACQLLDDQL